MKAKVKINLEYLGSKICTAGEVFDVIEMLTGDRVCLNINGTKVDFLASEVEFLNEMSELNNTVKFIDENGDWSEAKIEWMVECDGKEYCVIHDAYISDRIPDFTPNADEPNDDGEFVFEMEATCVDATTGARYIAVWHFWTQGGEIGDLDSYDYSKAHHII